MRDLLRLLAFLLRLCRDVQRAKLRIVLVVLLGLASGPASAGVLALLTGILSGAGPATPTALWSFAALCLVLPMCRYVSQMMLFDLSQSSLLELRLQLSRRVLRAPLRLLEQIGGARLVAVLATDIGTIVDSMALLPTVLMQASLLVSCLVYLAWLDLGLLFRVALYLAVSMVAYSVSIRRALLHMRRARLRWNDVVGQIRSMVDGAKELKMHRRRRGAFLDTVEGNTRGLLADQRRGQIAYVLTSSWGQMLFYLLVGMIVFVMPRFEPLPNRTLIGYTVILFQMLSPIEVFLSALPALSRAAVAVDTVQNLGLSLGVEPSEPESEMPADPAWGRLDLSGVSHVYHRRGGESFLLGPVDLSFQPGELVFLVGGNGSGKTTLAKLLVGLYAPESGEVRFAGRPVAGPERERYREHFSVIFSDFFLFESLLGLDGTKLDEEARRYLQRLHLDHKVRVEAGVLSSVDLSQGERKRLALLTAYLEDRAIYLFDEWAADQDPVFKEIFYLELLPELKRRGKTVFVISHDDHYFHVADRVIKLDCGQVEYDRSRAEHQAAGGGFALELKTSGLPA
jgi:putative ATP-binding cassette transporter